MKTHGAMKTLVSLFVVTILASIFAVKRDEIAFNLRLYQPQHMNIKALNSNDDDDQGKNNPKYLNILERMDPPTDPEKDHTDKKDDHLEGYIRILKRHASENVIILALIDTGYMDMVLNFYESSIKKFQIQNIVFIANDVAACKYLDTLSIPCFSFKNLTGAAKASKYGSAVFKEKMKTRASMILSALESGFTVLHTDVDIFFLKNPLKYMNMNGKDIAALTDFRDYNAGFVYIRPTNNSKTVYKKMIDIFNHNSTTGDQPVFNSALKSVYNLEIERLPEDKFLNGRQYFTRGHRYFAGENLCSECIVVHNNWIVSKEAKRYRFAENHMWVYDGDGYYSSTTRKYITYANPVVFDDDNVSKMNELRALSSALYIGNLLNRTLILPRFHCHTTGKKFEYYDCTLNDLKKIAAFDRKFYLKYRESTFLSHPKVPKIVRSSFTDIYWIQTNQAQEKIIDDTSKTVILKPKNENTGPSEQELLNWFVSEKSSVLRFHSMYNIFGNATVPIV